MPSVAISSSLRSYPIRVIPSVYSTSFWTATLGRVPSGSSCGRWNMVSIRSTMPTLSPRSSIATAISGQPDMADSEAGIRTPFDCSNRRAITTNKMSDAADTRSAPSRRGVSPNLIVTSCWPDGISNVIKPSGSDGVVCVGCPSTSTFHPGKKKTRYLALNGVGESMSKRALFGPYLASSKDAPSGRLSSSKRDIVLPAPYCSSRGDPSGRCSTHTGK